MVTTKEQKITNDGQDVRKNGNLVDGNVKMVQPLWKTEQRSLKNFKLPHDPTFPIFGGIHPKEFKQDLEEMSTHTCLSQHHSQ